MKYLFCIPTNRKDETKPCERNDISGHYNVTITKHLLYFMWWVQRKSLQIASWVSNNCDSCWRRTQKNRVVFQQVIGLKQIKAFQRK